MRTPLRDELGINDADALEALAGMMEGQGRRAAAARQAAQRWALDACVYVDACMCVDAWVYVDAVDADAGSCMHAYVRCFEQPEMRLTSVMCRPCCLVSALQV